MSNSWLSLPLHMTKDDNIASARVAPALYLGRNLCRSVKSFQVRLYPAQCVLVSLYATPNRLWNSHSLACEVRDISAKLIVSQTVWPWGCCPKKSIKSRGGSYASWLLYSVDLSPRISRRYVSTSSKRLWILISRRKAASRRPQCT